MPKVLRKEILEIKNNIKEYKKYIPIKIDNAEVLYSIYKDEIIFNKENASYYFKFSDIENEIDNLNYIISSAKSIIQKLCKNSIDKTLNITTCTFTLKYSAAHSKFILSITYLNDNYTMDIDSFELFICIINTLFEEQKK